VLLTHVLRRQDGVITYAQALECGLSGRQIEHRKATGSWLRVGPQVYFTADRVFGDRARLRTAVYSAGTGAAADGLAAAWWLGLVDRLPGTVTVTVPRARRPTRVDRCVVRRRNLHASDLVSIRELWVTDLALTVLEAAVATPDGSALLDRALQRRTTLTALHSAHRRNLGRHGSRAAGELLVVAADRAGSHAERLLIRLFREAGIGGWRTGYRVHSYLLDFAFPAEKLAIEVDGWAFHSDADRFQGDRTRQNTLINEGWRVLRFTWHDLTGRPDAVVTQVRHELDR